MPKKNNIENEKNDETHGGVSPALKEALKKKRLLQKTTKDLEGETINPINLLTHSKISHNKNALSKKYSVLKFYKGLVFLLMIVATGFFIYSLVQYFDVPKVAREMLENAMITSTITYIITMFSLFCLTKMIGFLFDLDMDKSDK